MVAAVPVATRGHFCTTAAGAAVARATWGHFCLGVVIAEGETDFGGSQFPDRPWLVFKPITEELLSQLPVDAKVLEYTQDSETEFIIDGKKYELVEKRTPSEIIKAAPDVDKLLDKAVEKLGITRRKAKRELYNEVIKNLKEVESVKESVFNDDEEIIMILVATDDI